MSRDNIFSIFSQREAPYVTAAAFRTLYNHTHLSVYRFIYSLHGPPKEDVEDLTAETYTRAWKKRTSFQGDEDAAMGWLVTIARNLVFDKMRKVKRVNRPAQFDSLSPQPSSASVESEALLEEKNEQLLVLLQSLSSQEREIIVLRYILDWRVKQIADHLDIRENTVSVKIKRTLEKLHTQMADMEKNQDESEE